MLLNVNGQTDNRNLNPVSKRTRVRTSILQMKKPVCPDEMTLNAASAIFEEVFLFRPETVFFVPCVLMGEKNVAELKPSRQMTSHGLRSNQNWKFVRLSLRRVMQNCSRNKKNFLSAQTWKGDDDKTFFYSEFKLIDRLSHLLLLLMSIDEVNRA